MKPGNNFICNRHYYEINSWEEYAHPHGMQKGHSQYMGMSSKDNELVVHYDSEINRPIWGGCMVEETGLSTAKKQLDQKSETRKRLHNGGWKGKEILYQSRHGGTATHHAPAPSGGHGEHK